MAGSSARPGGMGGSQSPEMQVELSLRSKASTGDQLHLMAAQSASSLPGSGRLARAKVTQK